MLGLGHVKAIPGLEKHFVLNGRRRGEVVAIAVFIIGRGAIDGAINCAIATMLTPEQTYEGPISRLERGRGPYVHATPTHP